VVVAPLDFGERWPYLWSRLEDLAWKAGLEVGELRAYLEAEVARRQAELTPEVTVTAGSRASGAEP
jgi:hypothetical protein